MKLKINGNIIVLGGRGEESQIRLRENTSEGVCIGSIAKLVAPSEAESGSIREDEQYIYPVFRALSKIVIPGYWLNFTLGNVLKSSTVLLKNQTVYPNHDTDVEKWLGVVEDSAWSEKSDPNGIDITLKIDKIINPRIAAGLKMRPPALHSGSVGIRFKWQKSHPDLDQFWYKLGTTVDNKLVTIDITEITSYTEFSVVYQGADPYAKQQLRAPQFEGDEENNASLISESHAQEEKNVKLKKQFCEKLGLKTESLFAQGVEEVEISQAQFDALMADIERVNASLAAENKTLKPKAELGEQYEKSLRDDAEKFYRLCTGDKADDAVIKTLQSADIETVKALTADYKARAEQLHPSKNRQSSVTTDGNSQRSKAGDEDAESFKIK